MLIRPHDLRPVTPTGAPPVAEARAGAGPEECGLQAQETFVATAGGRPVSAPLVPQAEARPMAVPGRDLGAASRPNFETCLADLDEPVPPETPTLDRLRQVAEREGVSLPVEGEAEARKLCDALGVETSGPAGLAAGLREMARLLPLGHGNLAVDDAILLHDLVNQRAAAGRDRAAVIDELQSLHASHSEGWKGAWQKDLYLLVERETTAGRDRGVVLSQFGQMWALTQRGEPVSTAVRMYDLVEKQVRAGQPREEVLQEMERITQLQGQDDHGSRIVRLLPLIEEQVAQGVQRDQVYLLYQWVQDMTGLEEFEGQALDRFSALCDLSRQCGVGLDRLVREAGARRQEFQDADDPFGKAVELTSFVEGQVKAGHSRDRVMAHVAECNLMDRDPCAVAMDPPAAAPLARPAVEQGAEFVTIAGVRVPVRRQAR